MYNPEVSKPAVEIEIASSTLFDPSTLRTAAYPLKGIVELIHQMGYSGLEWHLMRGMLSNHQVLRGLARQPEIGFIHSLHQSYRSEKSIAQVLKHPNLLLALVSFGLFPERIASLAILELIQERVGRKLPIVLYLPHVDEESGLQRSFSEKLIQPTPAVMKEWDVSTVEALIAKMHELGYTGFCLDLLHMRQAAIDGIGMNPWQESLPKLLPHATEIHVPAGRTDIPSAPEGSGELAELLAGKGESDLMAMLRMINELEWTGRIVTEVPAAALRARQSTVHPISSLGGLINDHRRITDTIRQIFV